MNAKLLYALWGGLFILCAGLGFIPEPEGTLQIVLTAASLVFFLPPALLLIRSRKEKDAAALQLIRNLSSLSLALTLLVLILNFLSALRSEFLGQVLHSVLIIVSSPMICSGHWAMSLFFWACLLMGSLRALKQIQ